MLVSNEPHDSKFKQLVHLDGIYWLNFFLIELGVLSLFISCILY